MFQDERYRALSPSNLPSRKKCNIADPPGGGGGSRTNTNRNVAGRDASAFSLENFNDETIAEGEQRFEDDKGEHEDVAEEKLRHHERTNDEQSSQQGARRQDGKRVLNVAIDDSHRIWGSRPLALIMFQRAAELGHTGAIGEVRRLRLRERMDHLTRAGCRAPARGVSRR